MGFPYLRKRAAAESGDGGVREERLRAEPRREGQSVEMLLRAVDLDAVGCGALDGAGLERDAVGCQCGEERVGEEHALAAGRVAGR